MSDEPLHTIRLDGDDATDATGATDEPRVEREPPRRTPELRRMESQLTDLYVQVGVIMGIAGGRTGNLAGHVIARKSDVLSESWIDLAERDQRVRRAIKNVLQAGGWSGVVAAHVSVALPIMAVAGVLPQPVAEKVMLGLMMQDPELFTTLTGQAKAAAEANGAGGRH